MDAPVVEVAEPVVQPGLDAEDLRGVVPVGPDLNGARYRNGRTQLTVDVSVVLVIATGLVVVGIPGALHQRARGLRHRRADRPLS
jgi:hypothetical protein